MDRSGLRRTDLGNNRQLLESNPHRGFRREIGRNRENIFRGQEPRSDSKEKWKLDLREYPQPLRRRQSLLKLLNLKKEVVAYRMVRLAIHLQNEKSLFWLRTRLVLNKRRVATKSGEGIHLFERLSAIKGYRIVILPWIDPRLDSRNHSSYLDLPHGAFVWHKQRNLGGVSASLNRRSTRS